MNQAQSTQECDRPQAPAMPREPLPPGTQAPDFELRTTPDQKVALSSLIGNPVVLVFCPADWSPVCGDQLALYSDLRDEGRKHRAQLLGISVDNTKGNDPCLDFAFP